MVSASAYNLVIEVVTKKETTITGHQSCIFQE